MVGDEFIVRLDRRPVHQLVDHVPAFMSDGTCVSFRLEQEVAVSSTIWVQVTGDTVGILLVTVEDIEEVSISEVRRGLCKVFCEDDEDPIVGQYRERKRRLVMALWFLNPHGVPF